MYGKDNFLNISLNYPFLPPPLLLLYLKARKNIIRQKFEITTERILLIQHFDTPADFK